MIQTMGFFCFIDKSFIVLSLECIAGNEGIFPQFPCFLYIRDIAGQFRRRAHRYIRSAIEAIRFTIIVSHDGFDPILFSGIRHPCGSAFIIKSIVIGHFFRSQRDIIGEAASSDIPFLIHQVKSNFLAELGRHSSSIRLPFTDPPVGLRSYRIRIAVVNKIAILPLKRDNQIRPRVSHPIIIIVISHGSFDCKTFFIILRCLCNDIHHATHSFRTIKCPCSTFYDFNLLDHIFRDTCQ